MVVICLPSAAFTVVRQDRTGAPSRSTVQAPHCPSPQPYLVPVRSSSSRSTARRERSGSLWMRRRAPLISRSISFDDIRFTCAPKGLVTSEVPIGGRAIWRAVTCVKLEQASKAAIWTPTRRETGEGSTEREMPGAGARRHDNHRVPLRSIGVVGTARRKGNSASAGEAPDGCGTASPNAALQGGEPCRDITFFLLDSSRGALYPMHRSTRY